MNNYIRLILDILINPLVLSGVFTYFIFISTGLEFINYIYSLIFYMSLVSKKKLSIQDKILIFVFATPSFVRICLLFSILVVYFFKKNNQVNERKKVNLAEKLYTKHVVYNTVGFFLLAALFIPILTPTINIYYNDNNKHLFDVGISIFFLFLFSLYVLWLLISLNIDLVKAAFIMESSNNHKILQFISYIIIIILLILVPDILYSILYSFTLSIIQSNEHGIFEMFYYSFLLHHQIPLGESFTILHNEIQNSFTLGLINSFHVITNKLVDSVIIAAIILNLLGNQAINLYNRIKQ